MKHRRIALGPVIAIAVLALAGCSGGDDRSATSGQTGKVIVPGRPGEPNKTVSATKGQVASPNAADIRFVQMMIPHHEQALRMTAPSSKQAASDKVKTLAERIDVAQRAEISWMRSWLRHNDTNGQQADQGHSAADEHSRMPGMASPQQMARLHQARGQDFDRLFLTLMITHHQGALTMATEELAKGTDVLIQEMAQDVVASQSAEINQMRGLLDD